LFAKAGSFVFIIGITTTSAAASMSRAAIHARPMAASAMRPAIASISE